MIGYILGLMTKGEAHVWSNQYIKARTRAGRLYFDTYTVFMQLLEEAFTTQDAPGEALQQLKKIRMDKKHAEDHNTKFKTLVKRSTLTDPVAIADLYRDSLSNKVLSLIINSRNIPRNISDWYNNLNTSSSKPSNPAKTYNFQKAERDPYAMDIDAMTDIYPGNVPADLLSTEAKGTPGDNRTSICLATQTISRNANPSYPNHNPTNRPLERAKTFMPTSAP
ncbi:unnamed protein product [Cyclocybe aegerita]|uniref:Retrotransposon gag domain-containing protein n=1 Tax=Cyclocybe aegerita TaxID=1973307 RepID=A0A8S0X4S8_CYCAE|nr:unnamed protein product [Cyclocybe aegerita]